MLRRVGFEVTPLFLAEEEAKETCDHAIMRSCDGERQEQPVIPRLHSTFALWHSQHQKLKYAKEFACNGCITPSSQPQKEGRSSACENAKET